MAFRRCPHSVLFVAAVSVVDVAVIVAVVVVAVVVVAVAVAIAVLFVVVDAVAATHGHGSSTAVDFSAAVRFAEYACLMFDAVHMLCRCCAVVPCGDMW